MEPEAELAKEQARIELLRAQHKADWREVLATSSGRRAVELLLYEYCGLEAQSHAGEASHRSAFVAGQRQVGITLNRELSLVANEGWVLMHRERLTRLASIEPDAKPNKTDQ